MLDTYARANPDSGATRPELPLEPTDFQVPGGRLGAAEEEDAEPLAVLL